MKKSTSAIFALVFLGLAVLCDWIVLRKEPGNIEYIVLAACVDLVFLYAWLRRKELAELPAILFSKKSMVGDLAKNDFKTKFAGSYLGIIWAFIQPIVTVFVYWFVFEKALNVGSQSTKAGIEVPYVLWLVAGLVPWFYFSDTVSSGTTSLIEYSYLVKKVVFNIKVLPFVKVLSGLFVHVFFLVFILILYAVYGYFPNLYMLQIFYFSFCMICLATGIVYLTSAIVVFFRDLSPIVNIFLQILVWATPIMWNIDAVHFGGPIKFILKLNPMFYVIKGCRGALINEDWFFSDPIGTIYFWSFTLLMFCFGSHVFNKLRDHFADVL